MLYVGHVAHRGQPRNLRILVGKPEGKRPIWRHGIQVFVLKRILNQFGMESFVSVVKLVSSATKFGQDTNGSIHVQLFLPNLRGKNLLYTNT
jgi:hypothetical protein